MKQTTMSIVILVVFVAAVGGYAWYSSQAMPAGGVVKDGDADASTTTPEAPREQTPQGLAWSESAIMLDGRTVLTIDEFPDQIRVSDDAVFGGSERITGAELSPGHDWIAVAVSGAAHSFGWVYNVSEERLKPVAFQYGGGVEVKEWKSATEVVFETTSPKPSTETKTVDVNSLPEYPAVAE